MAEDLIGVLDRLSSSIARSFLPGWQAAPPVPYSGFLGRLATGLYRSQYTPRYPAGYSAGRSPADMGLWRGPTVYPEYLPAHRRPQASRPATSQDAAVPKGYAETPPPPDVTPGLDFGSGRFSPFDDIFKHYAGELADDPLFISAVAAAVLHESGFNPQAVGDGGASHGLFQMHDRGAGAGMTIEERQDPWIASSKMIPRFARAYYDGLARGLTGEELVSHTARYAERPYGYDDPNGHAARAYKAAWRRVMAAAHGG